MSVSAPETNINPAEEVAAKVFTLADIEKKYYEPNEAGEFDADAINYLSQVETVAKAAKSFRTNFDAEQDGIPEGYGLLILPISKRGTDGNETIGAAIVAVPTLATTAGYSVDGNSVGEDFIQDAVLAAFSVKVANAVRPRADGTVAGSIPRTLADFLESRKRGEGFKTYTAIASDMVKALKEKGLKNITTSMLRQCLSSKQAAESFYRTVSQDKWVKILDAMIGLAAKRSLDPAILIDWKNTRDEAELEAVDLNFDDIADLVK